MIEYSLSLQDSGAHELAISCLVPTQPTELLRVNLPAWIPGSYMIRDFARNLLDLRAYSAAGDALSLTQLDKQRWEVCASDQSIRFEYKIYAFDESVRTAYFDNTRAFLNGTSVFLRAERREAQPVSLQLAQPVPEFMSDWRVETTLPSKSVDAQGFGRYRADNYDHLIDHPIEIGDQENIDFEVDKVPHRMVFVDAPGVDLQRIAADLAPICAEHVAMFGELPVQRYSFLTLATSNGYGGLEHRDSTSLICKRADLPYPATDKIQDGYRTFLALCSHEYFHLWNVKRIRPQKLAESYLDTETHTELLWAFEGITSYYDELALARAGTLDAKAYLQMLAPSISRYLRTHGRTRQSIAASSFDAWTRFYKQDANAPNVIVSYYNKGGLVAFGLDHLIRTRSQDRFSLDDLMRALWQRFGKPDIGLAERGDIEQLVEELINAPPNEFFDNYVYGTDELPLAQWFADFGIGMRARGAKSASDVGTAVEPDDAAPNAVLTLGIKTSSAEGGVKIEQTQHGLPAREAGLSIGDLIVAIDGERCHASNMEQLLSRYALGTQITVTYFRRDRLKTASLTLVPNSEDTCDLWLMPEDNLDQSVIRRRTAWLRSSRESG